MKDFLHHPHTTQIIQAALKEDIGMADHTSLATIPQNIHSQAVCLIKDEGTLAGIALAKQIFLTIDPSLSFETHIDDGQKAASGDIAFHVKGPARSILMGERVMLNFLQRLSGIATLTHKVVQQLEGLSTKVLDTRKTTPLIRHMEKWAVHIGGGVNHRFGLYDAIMIKDNHVDVAGGISQAIHACMQYIDNLNLNLPIIVETRNLKEIEEVLQFGSITRILLDNMNLTELTQAVKLIDSKISTEASGGIQLNQVRAIAQTGVDFISMGALTHSAPHLDISLKIHLD